MDTLTHYACPHCHGRGVTYRTKKKIPDKRKGRKHSYPGSTSSNPPSSSSSASSSSLATSSASVAVFTTTDNTDPMTSDNTITLTTHTTVPRKRSLDPEGSEENITGDTSTTILASSSSSSSSSTSSSSLAASVPTTDSNGTLPLKQLPAQPHRLISDPCTVCSGNGVVPLTYFAPYSISPPSGTFTHPSPSTIPLSSISSSESSLPRTPILHDNPDDASTPLIVISGCGIAGAALGLALLQRGFRIRIYERDSAFAARKQGYGLTMQQGSLVLATLGLYNIEGISSMAHYSFNPRGELVGCYGRNLYRRPTMTTPSTSTTAITPSTTNEDPKRSRTDTSPSTPIPSSSSASSSSSSSSIPYTGGKHSGNGIAANHKERHNIHLPRQRLRRILMDALPVESVQWGISVDRYGLVPSDYNSILYANTHRTIPVDQPNIMVQLSNGCIQPATLLIGSDGIHSPLRKLKIQDKMNYLDLMVILGFTTCNHPLACRRIFQTTDGDTRLYTMPFTGPHQNYLDKESYLPLLPSLSSSSSSSLSSSSSSTETPPATVQLPKRTSGTVTLPTSPTIPTAITTALHPYDIDDEYNKDSTIDRTMWQLSFHISEQDAKELASKGSEALKQEALKRCQTWHNPIPALLASTPAHIISGYPAYDRDIPSFDILRYGRIDPLTQQPIDPVAQYVVLIGDSMHPMSPFKGQGANQALVDAVTLAQAIYDSDIGWIRMKTKDTKNAITSSPLSSFPSYVPTNQYPFPPSLLQAIADFEVSMVNRAGPKVLESRTNAAYLHSVAALTKANCTRAHAALAAVNKLDNQLQERIAHSSGALTNEEYRLAEEEVQLFLQIPVQE